MADALGFREILDFWFEELTPAQWYAVDAALDSRIATRFGALHRAAAAGELSIWRTTIEGRLAEIIVLDQFSRNIHRHKPAAFAADGMALVLAQEAIAQGLASELAPLRRTFLYMPFMHSECAEIHRTASRLFREVGLEEGRDWEMRHKNIIDRFGRYPHRNAILGRNSTEEEAAFLREPGTTF